MWRLKQFLHPDHGGSLEGKVVDVGQLKLQVRNAIGKGGLSSVYLVKDVVTGKSYALKHIICADSEMVDLVKKEVRVMEQLRWHPNIVTLHAQAVYDMGRTKECFLVMDHCERNLVDVLDNRGAGYFEEKQLLLMFRDVCNAVCAMHCQVPPVAHRDLKAENMLQGGDGVWKLCDFGSTSTKHKRFEKPDEMGVEEDVIRKHTTPAYRAPEMWDLYQREVISEKVDIWALGCLLFRMAYFTSAFTGDSKLQILNGNYRIPELPLYSDAVTGLIKDMLALSPGARPDIGQVWRRVNQSLPPELQKAHPDKLPSRSNQQPESGSQAPSVSGPPNAGPMPSRRPPPPPTDLRQSVGSTGGAHPLPAGGSFWSSQYAQTAGGVASAASGDGSPLKVQVSPQPVANSQQRVLASPQAGANSHAVQGSPLSGSSPIGKPASTPPRVAPSPPIERYSASQDSLAANLAGRLKLSGDTGNGGSLQSSPEMRQSVTNHDSKAGDRRYFSSQDPPPLAHEVKSARGATSRRTVFRQSAAAAPQAAASPEQLGVKNQYEKRQAESPRAVGSIWELQEGLTSPVFRESRPSVVSGISAAANMQSHSAGLEAMVGRPREGPVFQPFSSSGGDNGVVKGDVRSSSGRFSSQRISLLERRHEAASAGLREEPAFPTPFSSSAGENRISKRDVFSSSDRFGHRSPVTDRRQDGTMGRRMVGNPGGPSWATQQVSMESPATFSPRSSAPFSPRSLSTFSSTNADSSSSFPNLDPLNKRTENLQVRPKTQPAGWAGF